MRLASRFPAAILYSVKAIALVCTILAVFPSAARAQYAVSYSGGTTTVNSSPGRPYGPSTSPYPDGGGGWDILVGQHCAPTLSGIPSALLSNAAHPPSYAWQVSGTTFQQWSSDTPPIGSNPYNPDASYYVDGPGPLNVAFPGWYWNDLHQTTETVSCTATVTPPVGQGAQFTLTATQAVTVYVPNWTATGSGGYVKVNIFPRSGNMELFAGPTAAQAASGQLSGMEFLATVAPPANTSFGAGSLILVQLVTPRLSFSTLSGNFRACKDYGSQGLDSSYPYGWDESGSQPYMGGDSPGIPLLDNTTASADLTADFEIYLMYFAPSSVQPVPVARLIWTTRGDAYIPPTGYWTDYPTYHGGSDAAGTVTPSGSATRFLPYNTFPMWTQIITAGF